jgi:transketolase
MNDYLRSPAMVDLEGSARRVREHIVRMSARGGCFIGAALSCVEILVELYARVLQVNPARLDDPNRDYLLLSKGHAVPALYATLVENGFFSAERLTQHLEVGSPIYWHPNPALPGVEFQSGSLGHLAAVGAGIALDLRMRQSSGRVFVIVGDGELNEGSIWEAVLLASAQRLANFTLIVDRNELQANVRTEDLMPLEPLGGKFKAFGWGVGFVDGHSFDALEQCFAKLPFVSGAPSCVIAKTVRGKGIASLEGRVDQWFLNADAARCQSLLEELGESERAPSVAARSSA